MGRHFFPLVVVCFLVSGCATAPPPPPIAHGGLAWERPGRAPLAATARQKRHPAITAAPKKTDWPDPNTDREKVLATLRPYSAAWWVVQNEIDAEEQRRINAKLVICRSCLQKGDPEDHTASVRPK